MKQLLKFMFLFFLIIGVNPEPFFRKKIIHDEMAEEDEILKQIQQGKPNNKKQHSEKAKTNEEERKKQKNKHNINNNHDKNTHTTENTKKTEKEIQKDIKKIGAVVNAPKSNVENQNNTNNIKSNDKTLKNSDQKNNIESLELALPEITITSRKRIEQLYPYFFKNSLVGLHSINEVHYLIRKSNTIDVISPNKICLDPLCEFCDLENSMKCIQCVPGHFLLGNKCYSACPNNYIADVYKRQCVSLTVRIRNTFSRVTYLKAFSTGSCKNMCGKIAVDCSCQPDCVNYGNCCSDYRDCEVLIRTNNDKLTDCQNKIPNCELCEDFTTGKCGQCKAGYYLKNNSCVQFCEADDRVFKQNMICYKTQKCLVEHCHECQTGNPSVCKQCFNGFFLNNNMCLSQCPGTLRADRINWMCLERSLFSWYWIFPSRSSCRNKCDYNMDRERDCSCREDCIKFGNCCQDIEEYCYKFILN